MLLSAQKCSRSSNAYQPFTRGQIATQHAIDQAALERANHLTVAPPSTVVAVGTVLHIPVH